MTILTICVASRYIDNFLVDIMLIFSFPRTVATEQGKPPSKKIALFRIFVFHLFYFSTLFSQSSVDLPFIVYHLGMLYCSFSEPSFYCSCKHTKFSLIFAGYWSFKAPNEIKRGIWKWRYDFKARGCWNKATGVEIEYGCLGQRSCCSNDCRWISTAKADIAATYCIGTFFV